jgi:glycosyltransferase involved in cell wall biosynthesis
MASNQVKSSPPADIPNEPFILAVSTLEVRKNYLLLYYTYKLACQQRTVLPPLVICGRKGWMSEETRTLLTKDSEIKDKITILNPSDAELEWLYANCLLTVFPSFLEGWGLPIAEALAHGKCCVSSNTSSMPEVGGSLVTYVSPYDAAQTLQALRTLSDDKHRGSLEQKIKTTYKPWTWDKTFAQLMEALDLLPD